MKRILIFSLAYHPHMRGAEVAIQEITDRISREDIAFDMVTLRFDQKDPLVEMVGNVRVYRVATGGAYFSKVLFPVLAAIGAWRLHKKHHYDAIWAMMTYMTMPTMLAKIFGVSVPHTLTLQDGDPYEKVFKRMRVLPLLPLIDAGFRTAAVIQTISTYLATWPKLRGSEAPIVVIPNGASLPSAAEYEETELDRLRQEVGKEAGDVLLVSVSRLVHQKAIDDIIRALPFLPAHVKYLCVGDGEERDALERLAKEFGVAERVVFVGQVDRTMTAKYRKISDIFVLPSRSEGQGISFLSTMVSGLPIIATQEGGIADFIFDKKRNPERPATGWAVDKDSPEQIAAAVKDILAHPDEAKKVVETAKTFAREHFDWDSIAKEMRERVFAPTLAQRNLHK